MSDPILKISTVALVGRGIIGSSWALVFARAGLNVRIWNRGEADGAKILGRLDTMIRALAGTALAGGSGTLDRVSVHASLDAALEGADYVQELIAENLVLKQALLREIERASQAYTILASSTSGLMASLIAGSLEHAERFLVVHPLTPPHLLPITEVCPGPATAPTVVDAVTALLLQVGQRPIVLRSEIPGFALNRILAAIMNEALALVRDGVLAPEDVDPMLTEGFGLRWAVIGPLAGMDLNAPGGVEEYLLRYGHLWDAVAASRGMKPTLTPEVIAKVAAAVRASYPLEGATARIARRDRAIAELRQTRTTMSK